MRENAVIRSRAVLVAIGIDWEGRRQVLGVEERDAEGKAYWESPEGKTRMEEVKKRFASRMKPADALRTVSCSGI